MYALAQQVIKRKNFKFFPFYDSNALDSPSILLVTPSEYLLHYEQLDGYLYGVYQEKCLVVTNLLVKSRPSKVTVQSKENEGLDDIKFCTVFQPFFWCCGET